METDHSRRSSRPILKLVHPGRFIEKYTKPITAAEVMRRHPRHCVARPDVFTNPWIVVRPESVLLPGNVFYVVSFHTLHRLMRSVRSPHKVEQISSSRTVYEGSGQSFADVADFRQLEKGQSRQDSSAEMPKLMKTAVVEQLIRKNTSKEGSFSQDMCRYFEESGKQIIKNGSFSAKQSDKSRVNRTNYLVKHFDWSSIGNSFSSTDQRYRDGLNNATELKSCLKKSENKLVNLRVRFKLPGGEVKMSRTCRSHFEQHIRIPKNNLNIF